MGVRRTIDDLSTEQLLGEAFMPRLQADRYLEDQSYRRTIDAMVMQHEVNGFCIFDGSPTSTADAVGSLQELSEASVGLPLIFSADCEWGLPMRLHSGGTEFPEAMAIARPDDLEQTRSVARAIAQEMRTIGIGWNFAPVADVNSNTRNPIINTRSFGAEASFVASHVAAFVDGLQQEGVAASLKHFPGHGDTTIDSHRDLPVLEFSRERFEEMEFVPFRKGMESRARSIMFGHIAAPTLVKTLGGSEEEGALPATVSPQLVDLVRNGWGYDGVLVTDGLEMHGLTKLFDNEEACLRAYLAGMDVLLIPVDPASAYRYLLEHTKAGRITRERLLETASRVQALREFIHVDRHPSWPVEERIDHLDLAAVVARRALEFRGTPGSDPFSDVIVIADARPQSIAKAQYFLDHAGRGEHGILITPETPLADMRIELGMNPLVVVFHKARGFIGGLAGTSTTPEVLRALMPQLATCANVNVVFFGSPYLDELFAGAPVQFMVKTFSESRSSIDVVIERLTQLL